MDDDVLNDFGVYCGCCGREHTGNDAFFCTECVPHINRKEQYPWDQTFRAQHGKDCPLMIAAVPEEPA